MQLTGNHSKWAFKIISYDVSCIPIDIFDANIKPTIQHIVWKYFLSNKAIK